MRPTSTRRGRRRLALALAALVAIAGAGFGTAAAGPAGEGTQSTTSSFVVEVHEDGSATVTLTLTFDLSDPDRKQAFESLQSDRQTRQNRRDRFRDRMASVAADAENATGREMSITDASIDVSTADGGDTGLVELSVEWDGMAAEEGDRLVVTEPFASGFQTEREFRVVGPDGYQLAGTPSPSPDSTSDNAATWSAGTDLSGFEATFSPEGESGGGGIPGFGILAALLGLLWVAVARGRRRL